MVTKFKPVLIRKETCRLLLQQCKANNVKFNACLNLILSLALRKTLDKFFPDTQSRFFYEKNITYLTVISNRKMFDFDNTFSTLGCFISFFGYCLNENLENEEVVYAKFWTLCNQETADMRRLIESDEILAGIDMNRFFAHFLTSNIGLMPSSLSQNKLIEFTQRYRTTSLLHLLSSILFMVSACSINETLSLSFIFTTKLMSHQMIDCLIEFVHEIIDKIIKL